MTGKPGVCREIEEALVATAIGDADAASAERVETHARECSPCGEELARYRAIDGAVEAWRGRPVPAEDPARARLASRLAEFRRRTLVYRIFHSPLGPLLIARSEEGVACVEYLSGGGGFGDSRLGREARVEALEDGAEIEALYRDVAAYLEGRQMRLEWPLDLRFARSEFHRAVLEAAARIPYGAVRSYAGIAGELGKPAATRAVAQALRSNPLPIVVPCHRVIGDCGALTGYAGNRIALKERLLAVEGVPAVRTRDAIRVPQESLYVLAPEGAYCLPTCGWIADEPRARLVRFGSPEHARAAGLEPCPDCRPDLHPISAMAR